MARGINKTTLLGNLGSDPETRFLPDGRAVVNFSLATGSSYKGEDGQWHDQAEWHKIVAFGKLAEHCAKHLKKGSRVHIEGRNKTSSWEHEGQKHWKTEVVAKDVLFLDRLEGDQGNDVPDIEDVPF